ncbi:CD226 antigen-like [Carcharodon carcharias]|uniref:CD226 antigen-like n=1 Tax=Carcharodon carcharias TaxID=13397 RepID=UPI001B7E7B8F|nr:CD226 antigen-like [Carcharodon carcharias]
MRQLFRNIMIKTVVVFLLIVTGVQPKLITKGNVTVAEGNSVTLQCGFSDEGVQLVLVEWNKSRNRTKLAVYRPNNTHHYDQRITMEVKNQHSTITIKEALKSDKGWYSCIFHTFPNGKQEEKMYLDVKDAVSNSFNLAAYVSIGVVLAVLAIGIILILLRYVHQRKSRVNIPNQINIILKNTSDRDNEDNEQRLDRPMVTNSDCEDTSDNYMSISFK